MILFLILYISRQLSESILTLHHVMRNSEKRLQLI